MQIDIFSLPIFVNNIDSSKIIIDNTRVDKRWNSETYTTFGSDYIIQKESLIYLLNIINETIFDFIKKDYKLELINIWENFYEENDFQENHIHVCSDFSFIIFKNIEESRTVFIAPNKYLIESFYNKKFLESYFKKEFYLKLRKDQIVIFPSFLEHLVQKTKKSTTVSGNLLLKQNENN